VAAVRRLRITDRATGTVLAEVDPVRAPTGTPGDTPRRALILPLGGGALEVVVDGWRFELVVEDAERADLRDRATSAASAAAHDGPLDIRAIIPGRVVSVAVVAGDSVVAGSRLLAVEAMKMENDVRAPRDGLVERVAVAAGETVDLGDLLVILR
jgi:biotin carboxyl carrier protein